MKLRKIAQMAWVWDWHALMIAQHLSYDSLGDRLKALQQLQLHPAGVIDGFPDWIQILGSKTFSTHTFTRSSSSSGGGGSSVMLLL